METLKLKVAKLLKEDALLNGKVWLNNDRLRMEISNEEFEKFMGVFVCRIQSTIDINLPERNEDLTIVIRNKDRSMDNTIKVWKPVKVVSAVEE